jgi:hypothetical protein
MSPTIRNQAKLAAIAAAAVLLFETSAFAQSVHLKPPNRDPSFIDQGLTLKVSGNLAGLGNGDVLINMIATAAATSVCINPGNNQQQPPGQNPADVTVGGQVVIPQDAIKNGNVAFTVTTTAPATPVAGAPDCPNSSWTEEITDLSFTTAMITVEQPPPTVVLTLDCTFDPATANGAVPTNTVSCVVS